MNIFEYQEIYRANLLDSVVPFWVNNSEDKKYGGFFTCLDEKGEVYDTDKFMWLQCRQIWTLSMLYNQVEKKQEWLDMAIRGAEFVKNNGRDAEGNWYFSLTREGKPIMQPYNIFSDCFAAMGFAQLYTATKNEEYKAIALNTFYNILKKRNDSKGIYNKQVPGTRPLQSFSLPMILCNLVLELEHILKPELVEETIQLGIHSVMDVFYKPEFGLILENVAPDGSFVDSFEGRLVNPGHAIESMWFIMDLASRAGDEQLIKKAVDITIDTIEYGWDRQHGGIFYFLDVKGNPPQQLEWDQKLWWVHIEAVISLLKGYYFTGDERCWQWFEKIHAYIWKHFVDDRNGEWFGYLNRRGEVLLPAKGGKWKGCFHIPRGLYQGWKVLQAIEEKRGVLHR
ncbi:MULTISPECIES: AGE family epimerase/isomerase [unclassified Mucilaginibacter]|uniref:AGE family epimerase/isomerase n=1 Tax=unclassified Mucilaginibacter TaxID=2617802 RepID=UPI002AC92687|nr:MULTISPECIES: AGE family epimerase/isomerase [unclassified Mucilaginibacter]MEB0263271.1 AGE family epimerase/isomerase [Mucilaginibacter sp. 10I4]MEB0278241.1 AGE family epimerase/isomerase [Mucilaginibacter sp. 10B2]MEB0300973.1 AGE family epimerase/isomerase [Mucilaginibacter sp. 5C4]WPX23886.1 AGE family epimerase/isomerase [Mucilaginibacter sp. 5C4]